MRSDLTVSIGFFKQGLFKGDAEKYIGKLINVDIGVVDEGDDPGGKT